MGALRGWPVALLISPISCGNSPESRSTCTDRFQWQAFASSAEPNADTASTRTTSDGFFCFAASRDSLTNSCWSNDLQLTWDEGVAANARSRVLGTEATGFARVLEVDDHVVVRLEHEQVTVPGCTGLLGGYRFESCIGVLTASCDGLDGDWLSFRDEQGDWTRSDLAVAGRRPSGSDAIFVSPSSCATWSGVWGSQLRTARTVGPAVVSVADTSVHFNALSRDMVLGLPSVNAAGDSVLASRANGIDVEVVHYRAGRAPSVIVRAGRYIAAPDVPPMAAHLDVVGYLDDKCSYGFYSEVGPRAVESLGLIRLGSNDIWEIRDIVDDEGIGALIFANSSNPVPWSMAVDANGSLVIDLSQDTFPTPSGHFRLVGDAAD